MNAPFPQRILWMVSIFAALAALPGRQAALADGGEECSFRKLEKREWRDAFADPCTGDWRKSWFLDGDDAVVSTGENGMTIDATGGYAVLWTKRTFEGDLRIRYDFKRLDSHDKGVNILYIQATGDGQNGHDEDITRWSRKRVDAAMSHYFNNMHTYHISYAAYGWTDGKEYVRARRYLPLAGKGLEGTELAGTYEGTGLFDEPGRWIGITVIKTPLDLHVRFAHPEKTLFCRFETEDTPPVRRGRIGLRLMPGRKSLFKDFRVSSAGAGSP